MCSTINDIEFSNSKVEELQLKSALTLMNSSQSQATPKVEPINPVYQFDSVNVINEQKLNLNLLPANYSQSMEEYDDDWMNDSKFILFFWQLSQFIPIIKLYYKWFL